MSKDEEIINTESEEENEVEETSELDVVVNDSEFKSIEDLPGVGTKTAEKLKEKGYNDVMSLAVTPVAVLCEDTGIGEAAAKKIIEAARSILNMGFVSGTEILERNKTIGKIKTGSENFDKLLGGGVETRAITECFGEFGSGKSQMAFQLAVNVQLPKEKGGLDGECVWIDTEGTFRPERIIQIAESKGLDPTETLKRINVARAFSSDHQILLAEKVPELINKGHNIKLVIVDSLMALFRSDYMGRGTLANRQQKLNYHLHYLQRLADRFNLAIYVTNQVMSKPDIFFGNPTKAVGGHVLAHACTYRIFLRKARASKRVARLVDAPNLPEAEAVFEIWEGGIRDG